MTTLHLRRRPDASAEAYDVTLDDGLIVGAIRDRSAIAPRDGSVMGVRGAAGAAEN